MLDHENLCIASVPAPVQSHTSSAIEAINDKVNVLIEKPLAMSTKDATVILDALEDTSMRVTVDYNLLIGSAMQKALSIVRSGQIGQVLGVRIEFLNTKDDSMTANEKHCAMHSPEEDFSGCLWHEQKKILSLDVFNQTCLEMKYRALGKMDRAKVCLGLSGQLCMETMRNAFTY